MYVVHVFNYYILEYSYWHWHTGRVEEVEDGTGYRTTGLQERQLKVGLMTDELRCC